MKRPGNKCTAKRKKAFMCQPAVWSLRPVIERSATRAPAALIFSFIHYIRLILIANKSKHPRDGALASLLGEPLHPAESMALH